jgi:PadR family transcriptional regulator, regulatory protein PadR
MEQTLVRTHAPTRPSIDYTDRAYWNGIIKMSLSKFFILCVLQTRPMHGYEISRAVERTTNGCCSPAEGTIYPALREFEQGGYVTPRTELVGGRRRKVYAITDRGREAFKVSVEAWMDAAPGTSRAKHVILLLGDGMGDAEKGAGGEADGRKLPAAGAPSATSPIASPSPADSPPTAPHARRTTCRGG